MADWCAKWTVWARDWLIDKDRSGEAAAVIVSTIKAATTILSPGTALVAVAAAWMAERMLWDAHGKAWSMLATIHMEEAISSHVNVHLIAKEVLHG